MGKIAKKNQLKEPSAPDKCPKVWEKARRDRLKVLFDELSHLLPKFDPSTPPSRPEIIKEAISYIRDLQAQNEDLLNGGFDEVYKKKIEAWKRKVKELVCRVEQLSGILKTANIHLPPLAIESVPSWSTSRPKFWTEKVKIPEEKLGEVIKQLSKKKSALSKNKKPVKSKKVKTGINNLVGSSSNNDPISSRVKGSTKINKSNKNDAPKVVEIQPTPPCIPQNTLLQPTLVAQPTQNIISAPSGSQPSTFLLTSEGNLLPVISPNPAILTPVIINRPPPLLLLAPPKPSSLPTIVSRPPPNKKRIDRDTTVMTFSIKRPISALSKHSHGRRGGKCLGHKKLPTSNVLIPVPANNAPAVSPTAAFLNSFPVVATPKIFNSDDCAPIPSKMASDEAKVEIGTKTTEDINGPSDEIPNHEKTNLSGSEACTKLAMEVTEQVEVENSNTRSGSSNAVTQENGGIVDSVNIASTDNEQPSSITSVKPTEFSNKDSCKHVVNKETFEVNIKQPNLGESNSLSVTMKADCSESSLNESSSTTLKEFSTAYSESSPIVTSEVSSSKDSLTNLEASNSATLKSTNSVLATVAVVPSDVCTFDILESSPVVTSAASTIAPLVSSTMVSLATPPSGVSNFTNDLGAANIPTPEISTKKVSPSDARLYSNQKLSIRNPEDEYSSLKERIKDSEPIATGPDISCSKNMNSLSTSFVEKRTKSADEQNTPANSCENSDMNYSKWQASVFSQSNCVVSSATASQGNSCKIVSSNGTVTNPSPQTPATTIADGGLKTSFDLNLSSCKSRENATTSHTTYTILSSNSAPLVTSIASTHLDLHQPQSSWLPMPPMYSNGQICTTTSGSTWRPITGEPSWAVPHAVAEPWKLDVGTSSSMYLKSSSSNEDKVISNKISKSVTSTTSSVNSYPYYSTSSEKICTGLGNGANWAPAITPASSHYANIPHSSSTVSVALTLSHVSSSNVMVNSNIPFPFTTNTTVDGQENTLWSTAPTSKSYETSMKPPFENLNTLPKTVSSTIGHSFTSIDSASGYAMSYADSQYKTIADGSSLGSNKIISDCTVPFSSQPALKLPPSSVPPSNYTLTELNTFNIKSYPAAISKKAPNYGTTFSNDVPPFSLEISKALFNEPPYSLSVPKTTCDSYFPNVPIYHSSTSTQFTPNSTPISKVAPSTHSVPFSSSLSDDAAPKTKPASKLQTIKETNSVPKSTADPKSNIFTEPKVIHDNRYTLPPTLNHQNVNKVCTKTQVQGSSESVAHSWNSPSFPQSTNMSNDIGSSWGHMDYSYIPDNKEHRAKAPINWMTEPEQRNDVICHSEDAFQPKYQNVFDRKEVQVSHNVLDFCFNNSAEEESNRGRNKRKDGENSSHDYFGWVSMKVDPLVVPSTLPTLVGDLALGGEPVPSKRCKTPSMHETYAPNPTEKQKVNETQEPFTNLSKNIFDSSQAEQSKTTNVPETIVLKNIFELPTTPSGKQRPPPNQNSFLSVSQLVSNQTHNADAGQAKNDYTYYNQRSGKSKRGSGWKCGEKKCQQNSKVCSSYSAEALLRSNDAIPADDEFPLLGSSVFPLEFQQEHTFPETPEVPTAPSRPKTVSSRVRKSDPWKSDEFKANVASSLSQPFHSTRHTVPKKLPDLSFSFSNLPSGSLATPQAPNIPLSHSFSDLSYPRFPSNSSTPVFPTHHFPQVKPDASDALLPPDSRSCSSDIARHHGPNRKLHTYSRSNMKHSFPFPSDTSNKSIKSSIPHSIGQPPAPVYSKPNNQIAPSPLHHQSYPSKQPIFPQHPLNGTSQALPPAYQTKPSIPSSPINETSMYCTKGNNFHKIPSSSALGGVSYNSKVPDKVHQQPNSAPLAVSASFMSKPSEVVHQTMNTPLPITAPYTSFPSIPPHLGASSSNSLANFNLTTIFPEMNKKGYQYS